MVRSHAQHRDAADEVTRLAKLAKVVREHENAIRERATRRVLATLTVEETVEDPDFPGCYW